MNIATAPPRDFESLKAMLLANRDSLPPRLIQVAAFALENPDEIALGHGGQHRRPGIGPAVDADPLCQAPRLRRLLGSAGRLPLGAAGRIGPTIASASRGSSGTREAGGPHPLLSGFAESAMVSLERLLGQASEDEIGRAADILAASEVIYLLGMRRAFPVTFYLAYALGKLGVRAVVVDHVAGLGPEQLTEASKRDALVAISFTPYTPMTVELTDRMAARGVPIIALTDSAFSPLSPKATVKFEIPEADYSGFRSLAATFCVAMAIAVATGAKRNNM